ncbi:PaaI family thioesterase [Rhodococcus sp. HNM0569]|uniref:PaaI family thioesterase n=1 Tax=Rhodococcus sp. HNM0569 TaxID=2716340 RepID=UPI00146D843D|nr:PaaI family thioesterase [Rhodococcus sp. HNM0569]NLU84171.1 PaaI family thioesterase [Rhodococcus sp. HNM0569]
MTSDANRADGVVPEDDPEYEHHGGFPRYEIAEPGPEWGRFVEAMRTMQDRAVSIDAPGELVADVADRLEKIVDELTPYVVPEGRSPAGRVLDLPGRGSLLMLPWQIEKFDADGVRSRGVFRRYHLGGNGVAHGGTLPLLFDDLMGMIVHAYGRPISRTAYLHVDYRAVTPLDTELVAEGAVERVDGRKTFVKARLLHGDTLLAECEALMIQLLPGQR